MNKLILITAVAGTLASAAMAQTTASNVGTRLTDGTAVFEPIGTTTGSIPTTTEPGASSVASNFRINGGTSGSDNFFTNWWWYRVNTAGSASTRELAVRQTAGTASRTVTGANQVSYTIVTTASFTFTLSWTLNQTDANTAVVNYSCTVTNTSGAAQDVSLFNYVDYFLANADAGDRLDHYYTPGGQDAVGGHGDRLINISDSSNAGWGLSQRGLGSDGLIVGTFGGVGGQIADTSIDNFTDSNSGAPVNPAAGTDISGIIQWNFTGIAAGGSATASASVIAWSAVPTPGSAALLGAGMLASFRRRRA
jgi:hypothetical protein